MNYDEIYEALGTIRIICNEMQEKGGCDVCPMSDDKGTMCLITYETPNNWQLCTPRVKLMR